MIPKQAVKAEHKHVDQVGERSERSEYKDLFEFVSDAIQLRLRTSTEREIAERLESTRISNVEGFTCTDCSNHNVEVIRYGDGSTWVLCPKFGWFEGAGLGESLKLGCREKRKQCAWL